MAKYDKKRDWAITVYPTDYGKADDDAIIDAEANWLHDTETGPFHLTDGKNIEYLYGCMEIGKSRKLHCHYRVYFTNRVRYKTMHKIFGKNIKAKPCYFPDEYEAYIRKEGPKNAKKSKTHVAGPWQEGRRPQQGKAKAWDDVRDMVKANATTAEIIDKHGFMAPHSNAISYLRNTYAPLPVYPFFNAYAYQQEVLDLVFDPPVQRRIIWVWSAEKNVGKTDLGTAIALRYPTIFASADRNANFLQYEQGITKVVIFDLPRSTKFTRELYDMFEEFSDWRFVSSPKYHSVRKFIKSHLIVITNNPPEQLFRERIKEIKASKVY